MADDILSDYIAETRERLERLADELLKFEGGAGNLVVVKREFHTLKGLSAAFELTEVSDLCHAVEDHFHAAQEKAEAIRFEAVFAALDFIAAHTDALAQGEKSPSAPLELHALLGRPSPRTQPAVERDSLATARPTNDSATGEPIAHHVSRTVSLVPPVAPPTAPQSRVRSNAVRPRILHVDDDPAMLRIVAQLLQKRGVDVISCADPRDVQERIQRESIQLVVSDIDMPRLNGVELLRRIKTHDAATAVIMLTGVVRQADVLECLRLGAEACVFKPIKHPDLILEALGRAFDRQHSWRASLLELARRRKGERAACPGS